MRKIDAHLHFVDFNQESDGFESLLREMDASDIEKAVVFGLPVKKKWAYHEKQKPGYYLDGYSTCYYYTLTDEFLAHHFTRLAREDQSRFSPLLCGFDPTDRGSIAYVEYMFDRYSFWKGIGELLLRHDELSLHTTGELPRANHPCLNDIYEFSIRHELPVLVHHNAHSVGYDRQPVYLDEVTATLDAFPDLRFIWAHAGGSSRTEPGDGYVDVVQQTLTKYPNLSIDISWKIYDDHIVEGGRPDQSWLELISKFPDRFMIGSDTTGHFEENVSARLERYAKLLDALPPEVARKVAYDNASKLYF